jgi:epoxyqueuosine reductase
VPQSLEQAIKAHARRAGFLLAGITTPDPPPHFHVYQNWLDDGRHAQMHYLADEKARTRRADPRAILPECRSILVLAVPYPNPETAPVPKGPPPHGRVAAYAWGSDYHNVLPARLQEIVRFIEAQLAQPVPNRWYTDTGPLLERDLAQRAGLGWIGKNTCLIHPRHGSCFLLAEILLGLELKADAPFTNDHCGTCTRCIQACPTGCILPDRTLDARRCISYLTIENKDDIPANLRPLLGDWAFGCDACQQACPWNRFSPPSDPAFLPNPGAARPSLSADLTLDARQFNLKFKKSPIQRAKRRGYLRNLAIALGNSRDPSVKPVLENVLQDPEALVREHAAWALSHLQTIPQESK